MEVVTSVSLEISKKIEKALRFSDEGTKLEGHVAKALGDKVIGFQKNIDVPG